MLTSPVKPVTLSVILFVIPLVDFKTSPPISPTIPAPAVSTVAVIAPPQAILTSWYYYVIATICS